MTGVTVERECIKCKKVVQIVVSVGYIVGDKEYYTNMVCPVCGTDMSENDRKVLKEAKR